MSIIITKGDTATLQLTAKKDTTTFDLTGATLETHILKNDNTELVLDNSKHVVNPDQIGNKGKFTVALTTADTDSLMTGRSLSILTKVTQGSSVVYFHGTKIMNVLTRDLD